MCTQSCTTWGSIPLKTNMEPDTSFHFPWIFVSTKNRSIPCVVDFPFTAYQDIALCHCVNICVRWNGVETSDTCHSSRSLAQRWNSVYPRRGHPCEPGARWPSYLNNAGQRWRAAGSAVAIVDRTGRIFCILVLHGQLEGGEIRGENGIVIVRIVSKLDFY